MKLEIINPVEQGENAQNVPPDRIMCLYDFDAKEATLFKNNLQLVILDSQNELDLARLDFVHPMNCTLILRLADVDLGITSKDGKAFVCDLTWDRYADMQALFEPFCQANTKGFQWLYDLNTEIDFLFSPSGQW